MNGLAVQQQQQQHQHQQQQQQQQQHSTIDNTMLIFSCLLSRGNTL